MVPKLGKAIPIRDTLAMMAAACPCVICLILPLEPWVGKQHMATCPRFGGWGCRPQGCAIQPPTFPDFSILAHFFPPPSGPASLPGSWVCLCLFTQSRICPYLLILMTLKGGKTQVLNPKTLTLWDLNTSAAHLPRPRMCDSSCCL